MKPTDKASDLTVLDHIAIESMKGQIARIPTERFGMAQLETALSRIPGRAYKMAADMLVEREKETHDAD